MKQFVTHVCFTLVIFAIINAAEFSRSAGNHARVPNQPAVQTSVVNTTQSPHVCANVHTPELICKYDPKEFNPRGVYYILGRKPKEFREFYYLELAVDHSRASGVGLVQTFADRGPQYLIGLVTNKTVKLIGATEGDFEYSFEGYFLRGGVVSDAARNEPVLKGKLIKSKRGIKMAECEVHFRVEYLGC